MYSLCRDLLQPESGHTTEGTLVLNTLPWERTEVISRTGPAGEEVLGLSNTGGAFVAELLKRARV